MNKRGAKCCVDEGFPVSSTPLNLLTAGLEAVIREHGLERSRSDERWLQNLLADYSPRTPALNRVAALAAREGVPGWLQGAAPGTVDAVVGQAVHRLATVHAIEPGAAHDAIGAWARALGVGYSGSRPSSAPTTIVGGERLERKIQKLLDLAEAAEDAGRWQDALDAYGDILALDPTHEEALRFQGVAQRRLGIVVSATPAAASTASTAASAPPVSGGPSLSMRSDSGYPVTFGCFRDVLDAPQMVVIPAGKFLMGSSPYEVGRDSDEGPQREVTVRAPLAVGRYPVTFAEWDACVAAGGCSHRPSDELWGRGNRPVINVSWNDAQQYVAWLSRRTGQRYRLLTEAEWEYAARAGTTTTWHTGGSIDPSQAVFNSSRTEPVGSRPENLFGLRDMHGNVWEWVEDCYRDSYAGAPLDASQAVSTGGCASRVLRGGSWSNNPRFLRSANRDRNQPDDRNDFIGFRVARTPGG
jgi:formylglycine-generating enzyme required for sulfatase activity